MAILEVCILLLLTVTSSSAADNKDKYGLRGGSIELPVDPSLPKGTEVTSIIWKHGMNKAAEWFLGDENVSYFALFKLSTEVSMTTWALKISNLEEKYSGTYSSEVNNKEPTMLLILKVIGPVSKPVISGCNDDSHNNCTLTCKGTGDGPLTYTWIEGGNEKSSGFMLDVQKKDQDVIYTCKLSNPVSQENTSVEVRKIVPEVRFDSGPVIGLCIFLLCVFILLIPCIVWIAKGNHWRDFTMQNWRQAWTTCPPCFYGRIEHSAVNGNTGSRGTDEERAVPCVCDGTATPLLSTEGAGDHPTGDTQSGAEPSEKPTATGQAEGAGDHPTGDTQSGAEPSENPTATGQERKGDQPSQDMQSGAEPSEKPTATGQKRKGDQPSQDNDDDEPSENPTVAGQEGAGDHPTGDTQSGAEPSEKPTATGQAEGAGDHPTGDTQSGAEPSENPTATGQERKGDQPSQDMQSGAEPFENPTATGQERKGDQPSQDMQSGAEPSENPTVAGQEATKDAGTDVSIL